MSRTAWLTAALVAAVPLSACATDDKPYAHESMRHTTAAEQLYGDTGAAAMPEGSAVVPQQPAPALPAAPLTVPQPVAMVAPTDAAFAEKVAASNAAELELSRMAYVKAQSPEVRNFARQLLIDHREMSINLDNFALQRGHLVTWRIEPEMASAINRLGALEGTAFDKAYMDLMVDAHSKSLATLEAQAASGRETASLASASLPTVRHHLEMARALDAQL